MANKYFTQLTQLAAGSVATGDALAIEDISAGETKYITAQDISTYLTGLIGAGGWNAVAGTWTYASASTITVPTGAANIYNKGMPIRWKQGAGYKYGNIVTVADTTLTIAVNTDYTVENSAITDMYYSTSSAPLDFPSYFNYAPSGISATNITMAAKYQLSGKICLVDFVAVFSGGITFTTMPTLPIAASAWPAYAGLAAMDSYGTGAYRDSGGPDVIMGLIPTVVAGATTFSLVKSDGSLMSATVPITWANGDRITAHFAYGI